jgi:hypothetical protein
MLEPFVGEGVHAEGARQIKGHKMRRGIARGELPQRCNREAQLVERGKQPPWGYTTCLVKHGAYDNPPAMASWRQRRLPSGMEVAN